jgi:hypothetical protein
VSSLIHFFEVKKDSVPSMEDTDVIVLEILVSTVDEVLYVGLWVVDLPTAYKNITNLAQLAYFT